MSTERPGEQRGAARSGELADDDPPDEDDIPRTIMTSVPNFGAPPPGTTPTAMLGGPQQTVALGHAPPVGPGDPDDGTPRTMMVAGFDGSRLCRKPASTTLPARRGPNWLDRSLRAIGRIPTHIGKLWRIALKPFGRAAGLRGRLAAPLMSLRMVFSRFTRMLSRWTRGAGE